jgi:hypothetical protein
MRKKGIGAELKTAEAKLAKEHNTSGGLVCWLVVSRVGSLGWLVDWLIGWLVGGASGELWSDVCTPTWYFLLRRCDECLLLLPPPLLLRLRLRLLVGQRRRSVCTSLFVLCADRPTTRQPVPLHLPQDASPHTHTPAIQQQRHVVALPPGFVCCTPGSSEKSLTTAQSDFEKASAQLSQLNYSPEREEELQTQVAEKEEVRRRRTTRPRSVCSVGVLVVLRYLAR